MKKFMLCNQDEEPVYEIEYGNFSVGILELGNGYSGYFVVNVVPHTDGRSYAVALFRDVVEAAQAVQALRDFAFSVTSENKAFAMPQATDEPVSALEIVDLLA